MNKAKIDQLKFFKIFPSKNLSTERNFVFKFYLKNLADYKNLKELKLKEKNKNFCCFTNLNNLWKFSLVFASNLEVVDNNINDVYLNFIKKCYDLDELQFMNHKNFDNESLIIIKKAKKFLSDRFKLLISNYNSISDLEADGDKYFFLLHFYEKKILISNRDFFDRFFLTFKFLQN